MTNRTYFANFFEPLCASPSDDELLAFAEATLANLQQDAQADAADVVALAQRGVGGKSASTVTLKAAVRDFLAWVELTNMQKVFPTFPDRNQAERIDIFPGAWMPSTAPTKPTCWPAPSITSTKKL